MGSSSASEPGDGPDEDGSFVGYGIAAGMFAALVAAVLWVAAGRVLGDSGAVRLLQAGVLIAVGHVAGLAAESVLGAFSRRHG